MRNDRKPLFTVIIPTKDRADYLSHTLRTCSLQEYENLEVLVSDDGSGDNTRDVVEQAARKDPRIRYISHERGVGMWKNFEFALNAVKPGYVMALGGDDGLLPEGISAMNEILLKTGGELLAWAAPAYIYPGVKMNSGQLVLNANKGLIQTGIKTIDSKRFLERQYKTLHYSSDLESPMFYVKGVTSTRLVDKVKSRSKDGRFYSCSTPDGYSGIVLAGEVENFSFSHDPFSIYGSSPSSQGQNYLSNAEKAKKQSADFFEKAIHMPMHKELASQPYSPLITLMTVDYLLTSSELPGWPGYKGKLDYKNVLKNSIDELSNGLWSQELIDRELKIINEVAKKHNLENYFHEKVNATMRDSRRPLEGNAISSKMIFLDSDFFEIKNIFDASLVAYSLHKTLPKLGPSFIGNCIKNSFNYYLKSKIKGSKISP